MGTTAEKLSYLNGTKRLLRRRLNSLGANITLDTTFRDYLVWLNRFYNAASASVNLEILGETTQKATTQSANILPLYDDEIVTDGVTVTISDGGKITINGTPTRDLYIKLTNGMEVEYETPTPNSGHRWYSEKVTEFNEETTINYQIGIGGGTQASTGNLICLNYHKTRNSPEGGQTAQIERFVNNYYQEKTIAATTVINKVTELNFAYIKLKSGELINTYGYIQASLTQEQNWVPNNDALPPSPDNPKTIINKSGTITYTASDGTTFPITLEDDYGDTYDLCGNPDPNGTPERIYYQNGKFYLEKKIKQFTYTGAYGIEETWNRNTGQDVYTGALSDMQYKSIYAISNYFKNAENSNIVDTNTAETYLNDLEFAIHGPNDDNIYLKYNAIQEEQVLDGMSTSGLRTWLSTHNLVVQCGNYEDEPWEINDEWASGLNAQLQAIVDYETKLQIEEKIF